MTQAAIEFRMLGPLEASVAGAPVALGGPKQRALMALLVLHANDVVPIDVLIEEMWEGTPPPKALAFVQNCVSRLRDVLGKKAIETRPPGYRLVVEPDAIDARRFERLVREARDRPARERAVALREALELWQGTPLSDLAYWGFAQDPIRLLEDHRINALQMRIEAELELGLHRESVGELDALAREHPTHERLRWLQMLALHRSDRRLDALAAYQEARLAIVEESGMEPGGELRALQRRILQDDPTLMPGGGVAADEVAERPPRLARRVVAMCIVELLVDEDMDVEAARGVASRGLASLEEIVLRHGGTVEQLLGEEAVAVFGLPAAHEDDVLRALRTAMEFRDALTSVEMRAAVETGEVLVGEDGRILSGGALTTARRLKEVTPTGEIYLGPVAAAQSVGAAWTDASDGSHRLLELVEGAPAVARRPDAPLVGRRPELERLVLAMRESVSSSTCRRVVVLGEPGIGKTRLAAELVRTIESEARVLHGRCVPHAEGATYVPLADVVRQVAGGDELGPALKDVLADETEGEVAATRLVDALSGSGAVDSGDVFWAARKLLEALARKQPVVVVLEDVHWAEPTFLDLIEYVAGWSTGAPIVLVCLARTELLDTRPAWTADTIPLRPLSSDETAELLDAMPEALALEHDRRAAVVSAAEGNPLFLEQLAAHTLDGPLESGHVPASLESLLASRLDSLKPDERAVLECAAIVGREFTRAAVDALSPDETRGETATALMALVRRRLVRPDAERAADDALLFDHALIRDATYAAVAKTDRARLHEQLARWLDERGELDEIVGYHLEHAVMNLVATGVPADAVALEAGERLGQAGERAAWSMDYSAAIGLLTRATELLPEHHSRRLSLECTLSFPLKQVGEWTRASELLDDVVRRAEEVGDRRNSLVARVEQVWPQHLAGTADPDTLLRTVEEAIEICEAADDALGQARAWEARWLIESLMRHQFHPAHLALSRASDQYERLGLGGFKDHALVAMAVDGPEPLDGVIALCERFLAAPELPRWRACYLLGSLADLESAAGHFDSAQELLERARLQLLELGHVTSIATWWSALAAEIALRMGDGMAAANLLAPAIEAAHLRADRAWESRLTAFLADAALLEGRIHDSLRFAEEARALALPTDLWSTLRWRSARARAFIAHGRLDDAEADADELLAQWEMTDNLWARGEVRLLLAEVVVAAGRPDEGAALAEESARLLEQKGVVFLAERARAFLMELAERGSRGTGSPLRHP